MPTIKPVSVVRGLARALGSSFKRPGVVQALAPVMLDLPAQTLDAQHIARYAHICGFAPAAQAPLTYPQMLTFPLLMHYMSSAACPWPAMGTVHLANTITQHAPLAAGDGVRVQLHTGELLAHERGQVFTLALRVLREDTGECVWQATQTLLRLGVRSPAGPPFASHALAQLGPDDWPLERRAEFEAAADIGRRYAPVSGDYNPIHLWPLTARLLGFERAMAHGLWTQARALALVQPDGVLPAACLHTVFKRPLFLPARASLWQAWPVPGQCIFEVRDAQGQRPHLRARLSFATPSHQP